MKIRKTIGNLLLVVGTVFTLGGITSMLAVGVEDMPESMKEKR